MNAHKPVTCHIIGDGASRDTFVMELKKTGAIVVYHGEIYDPDEKQKIFNQCSFGLNIMKDSVCVGLTMKSVNYFFAGLPILNNIKADTTRLVDKYQVGFNLASEDMDHFAQKIASLGESELIQMRTNTAELFASQFALSSYYSKMECVFRSLRE